MKIYLAYKYTRVKDKNLLRKNLEKISSFLESLGHRTFVLARDIKQWRPEQSGSAKQASIMFSRLRDSDILLAYVDSKVWSKGLLYELLCSKLLGKKSILLLKKGVSLGFIKGLFNQTIEVGEIESLEEVNLLKKALA